MHLPEDNAKTDAWRRTPDPYHRTIDEEGAPVLSWEDVTTSSASSTSTMGKPMNRGSSRAVEATKLPNRDHRRPHKSQRFRTRQTGTKRTKRRNQQVDSALARLEATEKSPDMIDDTLAWMEDGSSRNSTSAKSLATDQQNRDKSLGDRPHSLASDVAERVLPCVHRNVQRSYHQLLKCKASATAWQMRVHHDLTTFWVTTTPAQRRERMLERCLRQKVRIGMAFLLLLLLVVLLGSRRTGLEAGMESGPGLQILSDSALESDPSTTGLPPEEDDTMYGKSKGGSGGAATYFDNVDSLRRGSSQVLSHEQEDGHAGGAKRTEHKEESSDAPDIPLTAPWRPRMRGESKKPPPGLPEAYWHPRHRPITTQTYAKLKNGKETTSETAPLGKEKIKEYIPVVGNPTLEQWQRNQERKQYAHGA